MGQRECAEHGASARDRIGTETGEMLPANSIYQNPRDGHTLFAGLVFMFRLHRRRGLQLKGKNQGFPVSAIPPQSSLVLLILIASSDTIMYSRFG